MSQAIQGLKPEPVWRYFAEISKIPRGSKNEKAVAKYVMDTAKKFNLEVQQDKFGNVVVRKPATAGKENIPMLCLQGHLDMVCEKNEGTLHDFLKDPIQLVREGNILRANGTTLGADNGIAVATNLALMEAKDLSHGPLEFLFTIDEETGLTGASNLQTGFLKSKTMMNLDSEEEGDLYVGCSGGRNTTASWKIEGESVTAKHTGLSVMVKGLVGGHSGLEIHQGRGNAVKILNRLLIKLTEEGARVISFEGGNKHNAIPREAKALLAVPKKTLPAFKQIVAEVEPIFKNELKTIDPGLKLLAEEVKLNKKAKMLKKGLQRRILKTIAALPHGVTKMSADIPGLVETSTNVAVIVTGKHSIDMTTSQRSSVASEIDEICQTVFSIFELGGADVKTNDGYPGWQPNLDSQILKLAQRTYKDMFKKEAHIKAIHAGLECGIIGKMYPGMDMVSFGPTMQGVHSPDEKIYIDTVDRFYSFVKAILSNFR